MFNKITKTFNYGKHRVTLETGVMARQADASVLVTVDETVVLVTVVASKAAKEGQDFFPLTVDYFEKAYAIGKIPGGFLKRDGRPADHEILVSRLIDRQIRPLFPDDFYNEVQVIAQVLSLNPDVSPDILAIIGTGAALSLSGLPFKGPVAAARVGYINNEFILNPSKTELQESKLDLVVAGTKDAILMVESEAQELTETIMLEAIVYGHNQIKGLLDNIQELVKEVNPIMRDYTSQLRNEELISQIKESIYEDLVTAYNIRQKQARSVKLAEIKSTLIEKLVNDENKYQLNTINSYIFELESEIVRNKILNGEPRIDGRDTKTVRPIAIELGILPRTHGSTLFTRGETQALGVATLGTKMDEQMIDAISGSYSERFMLHYNFPPFSTGECGRMGTPKRREVGHGNLAKRALKAVIPSLEVFPYSLRIVSEVLESNGSSSMATVCAGCLAMMDAGVPVKNHVAGIAMGLILDSKNKKFAILTDILGDEDHLGDMDFKVAGTEFGITALQMDIKIEGITSPIMQAALTQAYEGRMHILNLMKESLPYPKMLSERVPRLYKLKINPEKIRDVIGKGGSVIRGISAETGATVDITDEGIITIACNSREGADKARSMIEDIVAEAVIGEIYEGKVTRILERNMGAMVAILGGREGFVHVSQIAHARVNNVNDHLSEGQEVKVKVVEYDDRGRMRLSIKATLPEPVVSDSTNIEQPI